MKQVESQSSEEERCSAGAGDFEVGMEGEGRPQSCFCKC